MGKELTKEERLLRSIFGPKCPECASEDILIDDISCEGGPDEGFVVFPAHCNKKDEEEHWFKVRYELVEPEVL